MKTEEGKEERREGENKEERTQQHNIRLDEKTV